MRFLVCVKQVPVIARLEFDLEARTVRRDGVPTEVSAFDVRALLKAIELRDAHGGEVVVLTMGPPQADEALDYCLALGADRAVHLCDPCFAGADTLATARVLAAAAQREQADLILLGRHSVDAETSQVGPELAELLGLPQITGARTLQFSADGSSIDAERETDHGFDTVRSKLPVVVTVAEDIAAERFPRKAEREAARAKPRVLLGSADLGVDPAQVGASGSPTWVAALRPVSTQRLGRTIVADSPAMAAEQLVDILVAHHGLFSTWKIPGATTQPSPSGPVDRRGPNGLWAVVEYAGSELRPVSLEILAKLRQLADRTGGTVSAIVLGRRPGQEVAQMAAAGAEHVWYTQAAQAQESVGVATHVLADAIAAHRPGAILFAATTFGRDVAPRLAARLGLGLTSDCIDLDLDIDGRLEQHKPVFGGSVIAPILSRTSPEMATLRPGVLPLPEFNEHGACTIESLPAVKPASDIDPIVLKRESTGDAAAALDHAEIVIGIGMGVGHAAAIEPLDPLIRVLGATVCATRDVTNAGWLPRQYQVGLTGRSISPKLYIGLGIRGAFEHLVGLRRAGIIVAINKNPKAMIFKHADYGIVGTLEEVVPPLLAALERSAVDVRAERD